VGPSVLLSSIDQREIEVPAERTLSELWENFFSSLECVLLCGSNLKLMFAGSRRAEQLSLRSQLRIVATVEDSVLRTEMAGLAKPGLLVFDRLSFPSPWALRSQ
jgi:hypothetical protein